MSRNNDEPLAPKHRDGINFSNECIDVARNILHSVNKGNLSTENERRIKLQYRDTDIKVVVSKPDHQNSIETSALGDSAVISPSSSLNQLRRNRLSLARPKMKKTKSDVELEQVPTKARKSNSENRRPPALQDNNMGKRRSFRSPASTGEILKAVDINTNTTTEKNIGRMIGIDKILFIENNSECSLEDGNLNQINVDQDKIDLISSTPKERQSNSQNRSPNTVNGGYQSRRRSLRLGSREIIKSSNLNSSEIKSELKQDTCQQKVFKNGAVVSEEVRSLNNVDKMKTSLLQDMEESNVNVYNKGCSEIITKRNVKVEVKALEVPIKEMHVNLIPLKLEPLQIMEAIGPIPGPPPRTDVPKCKEINSSLEVFKFKISQQMVQFYLLGRQFVTIIQLNLNYLKKATIAVVTDIKRSSFISYLVVADKTASLQVNLSGEAAKSWSAKLQIGQILLLTKFGLVMEGQRVRMMQVSSKDDIKVIGLAGNMKELNTDSNQVLEKVKMNSKFNIFENKNIDGRATDESIAFAEDELTRKRSEAKKAVLAASSSEDESTGPSKRNYDCLVDSTEKHKNEQMVLADSSSEDEILSPSSDDDKIEESMVRKQIKNRSKKCMITQESHAVNKGKEKAAERGNKEIERLCDLDNLIKDNREIEMRKGEKRFKMRIKLKSTSQTKSVLSESDNSNDDLSVDNDESSNEEDLLRSRTGQMKLNATSTESETDTCERDNSTDDGLSDDLDIGKEKNSSKKRRNLTTNKSDESEDGDIQSNIHKSNKGKRYVNSLLRFPLSESEEDKMVIEEIGKKKLRSRRKKISLDESKSETEKDDDSCEDKEHDYDISNVDSESDMEDYGSTDDDLDQLGNSDSKLSKDTIKDCSNKLTERTENKRILTQKAKNYFQQVALKSFVKRGERKSQFSPEVESKDIRNPWCDSSDEDSHEQGCSCHSCGKVAGKNKSSVISTSSQKDISQVPNNSQPSEPQLDSYFTNVDVSFDELKDILPDESISDEDHCDQAALPENNQQDDVQVAMTQQRQETKKNPDKISLGELWLGKERDMGNRVKAREVKLDETGANQSTVSKFSENVGEKEDEIGDNEEEYGVKETYSEYCPEFLKIGLPHPDPVMESSSLASVSPPAITSNLNLPQDVIDNGHLSNVQLEAVTYASQIHEVIMLDGNRAGFLIGDGAGVGKGRTIAGIILENWLSGRKKSVWISASQDLMYDAIRDLKDIGAGDIEVTSITSFGYDKKIRKDDGVIYLTFSALVGKTRAKNRIYETRLEQLLDWLGSNGQFQGPIIFDECHKAKNLVPPNGGQPTKTGLAVLDLQSKNPKARVVYSSATGASEPKNMAYMVRLGMWGQGINFNSFKEFSNALETRGTGGLEQVALDLKLRGCYIARQLSFKGVDFNIVEVPLTPKFIQVYNLSVEVWRELQIQVYDQVSKYPREGRGDSRKRNFWGFMQKFFKYLAISSKITHVVGLVKTELAQGNCVVIGLQSTGEAAASEFEMASESVKKYADNESMEDSDEGPVTENISGKTSSQFSSAASKVIKSVVTTLIPCRHGSCNPANCDERKQVWKIVMELVPRLPTSSLDQLIEELGGTKKVAELTGRQKRMERGCDGALAYVKRVPEVRGSKDVNMCEKKLFMSGKKNIAIISASSSTGISLQADKRVKNQRRRVHITIELPWSADSAIQQFGRTHRSNQSSAPKYLVVISALHGEKRFASIVAKRLENLGALTHGDRRSTRTSDLSSLNFHTVYAKSALKNLVLAITEGENIPMPKPPSDWKNKKEFYTWLADRLEEAGIYSLNKVLDEEQYPSMTKFMNRLLCVKVEDQNVIFSFFTATLDRVITQAKREGRYDTGIVDVVGQEKAVQVKSWSFQVRHATGTTTTNVTKFLITRGMSFEEAVKLSKSLQHPAEGFWVSNRNGLKLAVLVIAIPDAGNYRHWKYLIYRPNTGKVFTTMSYEDLKDKYRKASSEVARYNWNKQYEQSMNLCFHAYRSKDHTCKIIRDGGECEEGMRRRNYHVISGSLLSVWPEIEKALGSCLVKSARKIQMVRINNEQERIIGINIPNQVAGQLINSLQKIDLTKLNRGLETEESIRESKANGSQYDRVQYQGAMSHQNDEIGRSPLSAVESLKYLEDGDGTEDEKESEDAVDLEYGVRNRANVCRVIANN